MGRGAKLKIGPSIFAGQKKAPAGEERRVLLTGEGAKSGHSPAVAIARPILLSLTKILNCELATVNFQL